MRVAFLTTEYPTEEPFAGGLASYLRRTAKALHDEGHEAEIFTLSEREGHIRDGRVLVHRIPTDGILKNIVCQRPFIWRYSEFAELLEFSWRLAKALHRRHHEAAFDIVQSANYRAPGLVSALWRVAPLVTRISSYEPLWRDAYQNPLTRRQIHIEKAEVLQCRWSSALYAPSSLLAKIFRQREALDVEVLEPPFWVDGHVPSNCLGPRTPETDSYALFFGSVGLLKGCDRLVKILPHLLERNADMKFVFIGQIFRAENGQRFDEFITQRLARYESRVIVLSEQRQDLLMQFVKNARFVVLPSKIDNLPNTCMEAMALERVVIGTHDASFEQLIQHGRNGFLVSQDDDAELAAIMQRVWKMDIDERQRIGREASLSLERLKPQHTISELISLFEKVIAQNHRFRTGLNTGNIPGSERTLGIGVD